MGEVLTLDLEHKAASARQLLAAAVHEHARVVYANSLGAEAMVLTDIIASHLPAIEIFSIDTGRLPEETHELLERLEERYGPRIRLVYPDAQALQSLTRAQGVNGFKRSVAARLTCCEVRKVEPFRRAIAGFNAWVTGVRREHSPTRAAGAAEEWDTQYGLYKISPLLDWSEEQVWQYIRARRLPYSALHDRHYRSIGCAPCTRAIEPGEAQRAGRWWWEESTSRECGLHPRVRPAAAALA
ncbi:MAG TPA: phosphoadenylyl-sulfate reductase [Steroidobacteraceae bacterium]|jgi:phosphoadenosine phosphosulfate reductase|nr:phosphoadenylyl-sulfate reductase [Steroidobacteraceae bacterium]